MTMFGTPKPNFWHHLGRLIARIEPAPAGTNAPVPMPREWWRGMEPLQPYIGPGFVLVTYETDAQEQVAFNILVAALPIEIDFAIRSLDRLTAEFTFIQPCQSNDPFNQHGYVGAKWKTNPETIAP